MNSTNIIEIPNATFLNAAFDPHKGVLIALSDIQVEWDDDNIEFHFFTIDNNIVNWKSSQEIQLAEKFVNVKGFDFN